MSTRRPIIAAVSTGLLVLALAACSSSTPSSTSTGTASTVPATSAKPAGTSPGSTPGSTPAGTTPGSTPGTTPGTAVKGQRYPVTGNQTISVASGSTFQLALEANKTTGYDWSQTVSGSSVTYVSGAYEAPTTDRDGAGGTQVFTYKAVQPGTSTISLTYSQVGSGDVGQQYTVTVDVT